MNNIKKIYNEYTKFLTQIPFVLLTSTCAYSLYLLLEGVLSDELIVLVILSMIPQVFLLLSAASEFFSRDSDNKKHTLKLLKTRSLGVTVFYTLLILLLSYLSEKGGYTDRPPTHLGIFHINQTLPLKALEESGMREDKVTFEASTYMYIDSTRPEVEFTVKTDENGLIYHIQTEVIFASKALADMFYDETIDLWDAKFAGGNQGFEDRYHHDTKLSLSKSDDITVRIHLTDLAAKKALKDKIKAIKEEKAEIAFN